ncbi:MAG: hypothetical protein JW741_20205, partial [Sedimentisphaerales bacterium]|nr:hypothetical protein [Sedimentisphaerales bacterium]
MRVRFRHAHWTCIGLFVLAATLPAVPARAVTSKITRQSSSKDLGEGQTDNVVVASRGRIQLGRAAKVLTSEFKDVWSINSIAVSGGTIYLGTSPNGAIYKYGLGQVTKLYPPEDQETSSRPDGESEDPNAPDDKDDAKGQLIHADERFANQHVFALAIDVAGRLLAGISGEKARLCRYENGVMETVFEPNDARYIFAIEVDNIGNIYVGTGPEGKVYSLDPSGKVAQLVYDSPDKNILSLAAGPDGLVYAGADTRGVIYKINPRNKTATVVYDSDEPEISALLYVPGTSPDAGNLFATATSAKVAERAESPAAASPEQSGRPEPKEDGEKVSSNADGTIRLKIANSTQEASSRPSTSRARPAPRTTKPGTASYIYQ